MAMLQTNSQEGSNRIPVSVITGFLGSGKTTLLNHLVSQPGMENAALIINEFGEIGLDNVLVETSIENTLLLENGCICCSVRGDLVDTIGDLFTKSRNGQIPDFDRIVIETTGLADPAPIVNTLQSEQAISNRVRLDSVVTVIDGLQGARQARTSPEAAMQLAQADIGLISKADLAQPDALDSLESLAREVNPSIYVTRMVHGNVDPALLFDSGRRAAGHHDHHHAHPHDHHHAHPHDHHHAHPHDHHHAHPHDHHHAHPHDHHTGTHDHHDHDHTHDHDDHAHRHGNIETWSFSSDKPLDRVRLMHWLKMVYSLRAAHMLRTKGIVRVSGSDAPLIVQAVGPVMSPPATLDAWPGGAPKTQLVFILRDLSADLLKASFERHVLST